MKKAVLSLELATKMYKGNDPELKAFAVENYPDLGKDITERVKTFTDACNILGIDPEKPYHIYDRVSIVVKALNEGWVPDWSNSDQWKYYPWFEMSRPGVGFAYRGYGHDFSGSTVGSRLVLKSSELAKYAGQQFVELYKELLTIQ